MLGRRTPLTNVNRQGLQQVTQQPSVTFKKLNVDEEIPFQVTFITLSGITTEELAKHYTYDNCWVKYENQVYDITHWVSKHPGGSSPFTNICGTTSFEPLFKAQHPRKDLINTMVVDRETNSTPSIQKYITYIGDYYGLNIPERPTINQIELKQHDNIKNDCWVVYENNVYDITNYAQNSTNNFLSGTLRNICGTTAFEAKINDTNYTFLSGNVTYTNSNIQNNIYSMNKKYTAFDPITNYELKTSVGDGNFNATLIGGYYGNDIPERIPQNITPLPPPPPPPVNINTQTLAGGYELDSKYEITKCYVVNNDIVYDISNFANLNQKWGVDNNEIGYFRKRCGTTQSIYNFNNSMVNSSNGTIGTYDGDTVGPIANERDISVGAQELGAKDGSSSRRCWVLYNNNVYDITDWIDTSRPGGAPHDGGNAPKPYCGGKKDSNDKTFQDAFKDESNDSHINVRNNLYLLNNSDYITYIGPYTQQS
jgi:cytochrome b involved in lipid metabolism